MENNNIQVGSIVKITTDELRSHRYGDIVIIVNIISNNRYYTQKMIDRNPNMEGYMVKRHFELLSSPEEIKKIFDNKIKILP